MLLRKYRLLPYYTMLSIVKKWTRRSRQNYICILITCFLPCLINLFLIVYLIVQCTDLNMQYKFHRNITFQTLFMLLWPQLKLINKHRLVFAWNVICLFKPCAYWSQFDVHKYLILPSLGSTIFFWLYTVTHAKYVGTKYLLIHKQLSVAMP